jgi:hypothetical protein
MPRSLPAPPVVGSTFFARSVARSGLALALAVAAGGLAVACSSAEEAAAPTGVFGVDGGAAQAEGPSGTDAGGPSRDAGDGAAPSRPPAEDILGTLASGACGLIRTELAAPTPSLETNLLVFAPGESFARPSLSPGGQHLLDTPNAGGSSIESEVMSFEVLHYCEGASLLKTETEITYAPPGAGSNSITDVLVEIAGKKVGVSVTRAYKPPTQPAMTDAEVKALLEKKLDGILNSSARVLPADRWVKQILHVFAANKAMTDAVGRVWATIDATRRADTIVLVTQTAGGGFVYCNNSQSPPLGAECQ